ncbi:O-antigen ligase family protein [Candidatus Gottesmanbacteria bacterium]|nr:O-antigen ligase family protein [Candidatus Gottesmanbacteria bacterium]
MSEKIETWTDKIISFSFYLLFFLVPLTFTTWSYELFEYNKMMLTYAFTIVIASTWLIKMIHNRQILIRRTPFDIPLLLFLLSLLVSTFSSIDRHVSLWGYYSRFNGGLISIISYIILYYAFVTNINNADLKKYLLTALGSGVLVAIYGILQHLGIDKHIWIQDVQNRVFSTLGQPNWLAAYLAILIPISIGFSLKEFHPPIAGSKFQISNRRFIIFYLLSLIFYLTLIFTKSRSGFLGFWLVNGFFWLFLLYKFRQSILKFFLIFNFPFLILIFLFATPFEQINRFTLPEIIKSGSPPTKTTNYKLPTTNSLLETGITESGDIRRIVWKGALDIARAYPLFGTGPETFAFSYYKFRPQEHNMTSEWDFLYNKAHNEYLNYAATTGFLGLGTYLLLIGTVILWNIKNLTNEKIHNSSFIIHNSLLAAWLSILITNFLGFSVVIIQIYFFLIPAMLILFKDLPQKNLSLKVSSFIPTTISTIGISLASLYFLVRLSMAYLGDYFYAEGYKASRAGSYLDAYTKIKTAIEWNPHEVLYFDELSVSAGALAVAANSQKESTLSTQLETQAIAASNYAVTRSPQNVSFYKTRTRLFYELSEINAEYLSQAIKALETTAVLSPTDPKIYYNLGLMYGQSDQNDKAIKYLKISASLKPNYREAHLGLALYYKEVGDLENASASAQFILDKINPGDSDAKAIIDELSK